MSDTPTPTSLIPGSLSTPTDVSAYDPARLEDIKKIAAGALSQANQRREAARTAYSNTIEGTIRAIDDTRSRLEEAHKGQWNLPLMAFGAGMLKGTPGVASNFLTELGGGMEAAIPAIARQRMSDQDFYLKIGELKRMREEAPQGLAKHDMTEAEKARLEAMKTLEHLSIAGARMEKPVFAPDGSMVVRDQANPGRLIITRPDGRVEYQDTATGKITPASTGAPVSTAQVLPPEATDEDRINYLNTNVDTRINPTNVLGEVKWDKLAEVAQKDPAYAQTLWAIRNYEQDPMTLVNTRAGMKKYDVNRIFADVRSIDPTWKPGLYSTVQSGRKSWTEGKDATTITSLQTGINHAGEAMAAAIALMNGDNQAINYFKNKVAEWTGKTAPTDFRAVAKLYGDELATFLSGGKSALGDREELAKVFSNVQSPAQLASAIQKITHLVQGRMKSLATKKQGALGDRFKVSEDELLGDSAPVYRKIMETNPNTPEGRSKWLPSSGAEGAKPARTPTPKHIEMLKSDSSPQAISEFNEVYGPGAAETYLKSK